MMESLRSYTRRNSRLIVVMTLASSLLGCNPKFGSGSTEGGSDLSSRLPIPTTNNQNTPKDIALCNKKETPYLTAHLQVHYDQTGTYHPELIRLWISKVDPSFAKNNYQLVLRKWKSSLQGEVYQENTPVTARLERLSDRRAMSNYMDKIHWLTIATEIERVTGTTPTLSDGFSQHGFVVDLKDQTGDFDVLKISLYKDGAWVEDLNMLLPAFYAHPNTYATSQNAVLAGLHPFSGSENSTFTGEHFAGVLNGYCF